MSVEAAQKLIGQVLFPLFQRALFGMDTLAKSFDSEVLAPSIDLKRIRRAVAELIEGLAD